MAAQKLLMLEDNGERLERFEVALRGIDPRIELKTWNAAELMIREAQIFLQSASLISLDHDLDSLPDGSDAGDGLMVAKWLVSQPIVRPVIIHTSNGERSVWMEGEFDLAGWRTVRVAPIGDDWIETDWSRAVRRLLRKRGKST